MKRKMSVAEVMAAFIAATIVVVYAVVKLGAAAAADLVARGMP
jgi:hypothetical protein